MQFVCIVLYFIFAIFVTMWGHMPVNWV